MIISITVASSSTNPKLPPGLAKISHDEIVLVELQGSLEVECNHISERDGKFVGKLKVDAVTNKSTLRIGHHLLEGKIVALPKPLAVLLRSSPATKLTDDKGRQDHDPEDDDMRNPEDEEMMDLGSETSQETRRDTTGWSIVAIVKRNIVFSKRPMPIIS